MCLHNKQAMEGGYITGLELHNYVIMNQALLWKFKGHTAMSRVTHTPCIYIYTPPLPPLSVSVRSPIDAQLVVSSWLVAEWALPPLVHGGVDHQAVPPHPRLPLHPVTREQRWRAAGECVQR